MKSILSIIFLWTSFCTFAQNNIIVYDKVNQKPIASATCILLDVKDSAILGFARTNGLGKCSLTPSKNSTYKLWVWHKKFVEYYADLSQDTVFLIPKNKVLREVIVKTNKAVTVSGDTVTYNADSFKLNAGASVEDLLKKLPGLQVDKDGGIKAFGKKVEKVLIDGDDFFAEDATVATRNLDAKMIDKVEVIDDKSNKEKNTGVSDEEKVKVINLKLKDEAKKGYFGKIIGGYSQNNRFNSGMLINSFTKNTKMTAFLLADNIKNNLSWEDRNQYNLGNTWQYDEDLDSYTNSEGEYNNNFMGVIPTNIVGGVNVAQNFLDESGKIGGNYKHNTKTYNGFESSKSTQIFETNKQYRESVNAINGEMRKNHFAGLFKKDIDSFQKLSIALGGSFSNSRLNRIQNSFIELNDTLVNKNILNSNSLSASKDFNFDIDYELKFKKKGRFVGLSTKWSWDNNSQNSSQSSSTTLYKNGVSQKETNQKFDFLNQEQSKKFSAVYIEPIIKQNLFIETGLNYLTNNYKSYNSTSNVMNSQGAEVVEKVDTLSNDYQYKADALSANLKLTLKLKKITIEGGAKWHHAGMFQKSLIQNGAEVNRTFDYILPYFNFNWSYKRNSFIEFKFRKSIQPPRMNEIQPFTNYSNPLSIDKGNPNLQPTEKYRFTLQGNLNQSVSGRYIWFSYSFNTLQNDIVQSINYLENGITQRQYVQTNGNYNMNSNLYISTPIKKIDLNINGSFYGQINKTNSFINNIENISLTKSLNLSLGLQKTFDSIMDLSIDYDTKFSNISVKNNALTESNQFNATLTFRNEIFLPWKLSLESSMEWNYLPKNNSYSENSSFWLLNAKLKRSFGKWNVELIANDLLNQNKSVWRNFYGNSISESTNEAITRYFMASVVWRFNSKPKSKTPESPANED